MTVEEFSDRLAALYESLSRIAGGSGILDWRPVDAAKRELATLQDHRELLWELAGRPNARKVRIGEHLFASVHEAAIHYVGELLTKIEQTRREVDPLGVVGLSPPDDNDKRCSTLFRLQRMLDSMDEAEAPNQFDIRAELRLEAAKVRKPLDGHLIRAGIDIEADNMPPAEEINFSPSQQAVVDAVHDLWEEGTKWPTTPAVIKKSGYSESSVKNALDNLNRFHVLELGPNGQGYRVV